MVLGGAERALLVKPTVWHFQGCLEQERKINTQHRRKQVTVSGFMQVEKKTQLVGVFC